MARTGVLVSDFKPDSNFVWTDVSTFDIDEAKRFYSSVFGWNYSEQDGYNFAAVGSRTSAGIFVMPEFLQKINMPSFWMSYVSVNNIEDTVKRAKKIKGVIIEVEPFDFSGGRAALIRDPAGAGFTVWEGEDLGAKDESGRAGRMVWNELYIPELKTVKNFYEKVFDWSFVQSKEDKTRYDVQNPNGDVIAAVQEIPDEVRGDKVFWLPIFAVASMDQLKTKVEQNGGALEYQEDTGAGKVGLFKDTQDAAFGVAETGESSFSFPVRTLAALVFVYAAVLFDLPWAWGLLFLLWLIPDLMSGTTYLAEPLDRRSSPFWYWAVVGSWLWMSVYLLLTVF